MKKPRFEITPFALGKFPMFRLTENTYHFFNMITITKDHGLYDTRSEAEHMVRHLEG